MINVNRAVSNDAITPKLVKLATKIHSKSTENGKE